MAESIYGVKPEGFVRKRQDIILQEISEGVRGVFGDEIDLAPDSPDGQMCGVFSEMFSNLWQLAEDVYLSLDPTSAQKHQLENIAKLNDIFRKQATNTIADIELIGDVGTFIPAKSQIALNDNPKIVFETDVDVTIPVGGNKVVSATCTTPGSIAVAANKITSILTPIAGWDSAINPTPAATGQPKESDQEFRLRRAQSTEKNAQNMVEATWARLNMLTNVEDVRVYENDTNVVDANGLPPHSIHVVIKGGEEQAIAETIYNSKSGGCSTEGAIPKKVTPIFGGTQTIRFSRPKEIDIHVSLTIRRLYGYAEDSTNAIKKHIIDYAKANFKIGDDVIYSRLYSPINQEPRHEIQSLYIGTSPNPSGTTDVNISFDEIAVFSLENIAITVNS